MEDYKEIMKTLLWRYYSPIAAGNKVLKSTPDLLVMFRGIIPMQPITEHDVYEVMKELGFEIEQKIIKEKVCIFEGDEDEGLPAEYDEVEVGRVFLWALYEV